jgi:hypothetical protein
MTHIMEKRENENQAAVDMAFIMAKKASDMEKYSLPSYRSVEEFKMASEPEVVPGNLEKILSSEPSFPVLPLLAAIFSVLAACFFTLYYFDTLLFGAALAVFTVSIILMIPAFNRIENWKEENPETPMGKSSLKIDRKNS